MKFFQYKYMGILAIVLLFGCKADPMKEHTAFLEDKADLMKPTDLVPASLVWRNAKANPQKYTKARITPIDRGYVLKNTFWESCNIRNWTSTKEKDLNDFALYFEQTLIKHLKDAGIYSEKPGPNIADIDIAIIKAVPGKPIFGAVNNLSNLTIFGAVLAPLKLTAMGVTDSPLMASVAIEGVLRDSVDRKIIIGVFADRRKSKVAYFDCHNFTAYGNLRAIADDWAEQITELIAKHPFATGIKIDEKSNLKLIDY